MEPTIHKMTKPISSDENVNTNNLNNKLNNSNNNLNENSTANSSQFLIPSYLDSLNETTNLVFEGFDFMNMELGKENEPHVNVLDRLFTSVNDHEENFKSQFFSTQGDASPLSCGTSQNFEVKVKRWTKKEAIDRNCEITLNRMKAMGLNALVLLAGDELTILKYFIQHMNLSKQCPDKHLSLLQLFNDRKHIIVEGQKYSSNELYIESLSRKISKAILNNHLLSSNFWRMINEVYSWFMNKDDEFIDEQTTKDMYLKSVIEEFEFYQARVN